MLHRPPIDVVFSREGVRALDRAAEQLGIPSIVLMENASWAITEVADAMLRSRGAPRRKAAEEASPFSEALILCGPGNNGGDGLAVARHLHNLGYVVRIVLAAGRDALSGDARTNLIIAEKMGLPIGSLPEAAASPRESDHPPLLVIDALLGTGQTRAVGPPIDGAVRYVNRMGALGAQVLAVDLPTGLDADSGRPLGDPELTVRATRTITLAGLKKGFLNPASRAWTGEVVVGGIGVPESLLRQFADARP